MDFCFFLVTENMDERNKDERACLERNEEIIIIEENGNTCERN